MAAILSQPPKYLRSLKAKPSGVLPRVDRRGGFDKAGIIRGVSVITKGEALGHDLWVDDVMLEQVADGINMANKGVKARFTHPGLSGDGLGRYVGRVMDARVENGQVIADEHFSSAGHKTPDGDLAGYLLDLAESDPEAYGLSIVFSQDEAAADEFEAEHAGDTGFESPDPLNVRQLRHARVASLHAVDSVDEPAANPNGLFHRGQDIAIEADAALAYALGLSDEKPEQVAFGVDPDRARQFVARFLSNHNLKVSEMAEDKTPADEPIVAEVEENTAELSADNDTPEVGDTAAAPEPVEPAPVVQASADEVFRFFDAFGEKGIAWAREGKSFTEALNLHNEALRQENEELRKRVNALSSGEAEPVAFDAESRDDVNKTRGTGLASRIKLANK